MEGNDFGYLGAGVILGMVLSKTSTSTPIVTPQAPISNYKYSFPDVWKALFINAAPDILELSRLLTQKYFYSFVRHSLAQLEFNHDRERGRALIKDCFDRFQCNSLGLETTEDFHGYHTIHEFSAGVCEAKACLIKLQFTSAANNFLISPLGMSDLVDEVKFNIALRNANRQFYIKERLSSHFVEDFSTVVYNTTLPFSDSDPLFLRKLGSLIVFSQGYNAFKVDSKLSKVLDLLDNIHIFSDLSGSKGLVYLARKPEWARYHDFINKITDIYYE